MSGPRNLQFNLHLLLQLPQLYLLVIVVMDGLETSIVMMKITMLLVNGTVVIVAKKIQMMTGILIVM